MSNLVDSFAGGCNAALIVLGVVGAAFTGVLADKTKRFEELLKIFFTGVVISCAAFVIVSII